jgi:uncharacterized protein GlcG (DUF336 family)
MKKTLLALSLVCMSTLTLAQTAGQPAAAQTPPPPPARGPSLQLAVEAANVAITTCRGIDQRVGVSVIDSSGAVKVLLTGDGASPRGAQNATLKALTALTFNVPSSQVAELAKKDPSVAAKLAANSGYLNRAGGILIVVGNEVIGAIGVGGARGSEKDEACAIAGLEKIKSRLQ